jgi:hypothetical protein
MKTKRNIQKKRKTRRFNPKIKTMRPKKIGGEGETETEKPDTTSTEKRQSKNDSKIRIQFFNPRTSSSPYSVISVLKGPTTGVFDYMWYNIKDIEEMLATLVYGLKTENPPLPSEIVYNVKHNEKPEEKDEKEEKEEKE